MIFLPSLSVVALDLGLAIYCLLFLSLPSLYENKRIKSLLLIFIASTIHLSIAIAFPFYVIYLFKRILLIYARLYPVFLGLYLTNAFKQFVVIPSSILTEYARSFANMASGYEVGMSLGKFLAVSLPFLFYIASRKYVFRYPFLKLLFQFFFYVCTIGILFSGLPYNDRVFLIVWPLSPILVTPCLLFIVNRNFINNDLKA